MTFSSLLGVASVLELKLTERGFLISNEHFATHSELTGKTKFTSAEILSGETARVDGKKGRKDAGEFSR